MATLTASSQAYRQQILSTLAKLPPFSPILNKVLATLADEEVGFGDVAGLIEKDAVLAGNILRLVNSPLYGRTGTVNSVRHAVSIVGTVKIRNLVLGLSVAQMWRHLRMPKNWSTGRFHLHSVGVGILADLLALEIPVPYGEGAFVAGLLHDIGKMLIAIALTQEYETIGELCSTGERNLEECETEVIGLTHSQLSGAVVEKWNLPLPIQRAVLSHHSPDQANGGQLHLAHVVQAADFYVNGIGLSILSPSTPTNSSDKPAPMQYFRDLGLDAQIPRVEESFNSEFDQIRAFF